jgi:hypothetical protein
LVDALQYIFIRDFLKGEITKRISLSFFPTCMALISFGDIEISEDSSLKEMIGNKRGSYLAALGTKDGKVVIYRLGV